MTKNPSDANATKQLAKIESNTQAKKVSELAQMAREKNKEWFADSLAAFRDERWMNQPQGSEWEEILRYEEDIRLDACLLQCKSMVEKLLSIKKEGNWKDAVATLGQIDSLVSQNSLQLDAALPDLPEHTYSGIVELARKWTSQESTKQKKAGEDKKRESELKSIIREIQEKDIVKDRKTSELRHDLARLASVGRDLQEVGQSLSSEDLQKFNETLSGLRRNIAKRSRNSRILIGGASLAVIIAAVFTFYLISGKMAWNEEYSKLAEGLERNDNLEDLASFLDSFEKNHPERTGELEFETAIKKGKSLVAEGRKLNKDFGQRIDDFQVEIQNADDLDTIQRLQSQKQSLRDDLSRLNSAYRETRSNELNRIDEKWKERRDKLQGGISGSLNSLVSTSSDFAQNNLSLEQELASLRKNLTEMNRQLVEIESSSAKYTEIDGLGLTEGQQDVVENLRSQYRGLKETLDSHDQLALSLNDADSPQALFSKLEKLVESGLTESVHYKAAKKMLSCVNLFENLEGKTFMKPTPELWDTAINSITSDWRPAETNPEEEKLLDQLYNDARLKSVFRTKLFDSSAVEKFEKSGDSWQPSGKDSASRGIWTIGKIFPQQLVFKPGTGSGSYQLTQSAKVIRDGEVSSQNFISEWTGISKSFEPLSTSVTATGQVILGGELATKGSSLCEESKYLYGDSSPLLEVFATPKVNSPALLLLDKLKRDPLLDPFVKCHIFLTLMEIMEVRPEKWGLKNDPRGNLSVIIHSKKLSEASEGHDLVGEWYKFISSGEKTPLRKELQEIFSTAKKISYYQEARFFEKFWKDLLSAKFTYRGFCTLEDKWSKSLNEHAWGVNPSKNILQVVRPTGKETIPYSPIMTLDKKISDLLLNARRYAGIKNINDPNYLRLKKGLPYPFPLFPEK
ncbi:MAG: hypothetical protein HN727_09610 [Opitutae bacterium]|nr:hypothetical protein [Opitutae bacterium]